MKSKFSGIYWGILFILAGIALMANMLGWIDFSQFSTNTWVYVFAGGSILFLVAYLLSGLKNWGLLFPTLILGSISLIIWLSDRGMTGSFLGMPILLAVGLPFFAGFIADRKAWPLLIPGWILTVIAFITLAADSAEGTLIGAVFMFAIAVPFLIVFLLNRSRWWALIPAYVTFVLGTVILLSEHVNGNLVGALIMYAIALPFLVVYLRNRQNRWAIIPAAVMAFFGTIPLLDGLVGGDWMGLAVMLLFSAAFFFVYFRWPSQWWAIIPAGVFASIAVVVLLGMVLPQDRPIIQGLLTGTLLLGFGLTFGALWLLRSRMPTAWARFPAIGLMIAAALSFVFGSNNNVVWALVLLAGGVVLVVYSFMRRKPNL